MSFQGATWGLFGLLRFGLHGSGVPSRGFSLNIEREFQKCEAQPAFRPPWVHLGAPPGDFVVGLRGVFLACWVLDPDIARMGLRMLFVKHFGGRAPNIARMTIPTARPPETVERRRRDRRAGRARAIGTIQQTHGRMAKAN